MFTAHWIGGYEAFQQTADPDGLGRMLPAGAHDLYTGTQPEFCRSNKVWGIDVDDIYTSLNLNNVHWVALMISIPRRHIIVWDSIAGAVAKEVIAHHLNPLCEIMPYLMHTMRPAEHPNVPYTYEVLPVSEVPQCVSGDCGVFTLKYIECHALDMQFPPHLLSSTNIKNIREKLAVDIYHELKTQGTEKRDYDYLDVYDAKR